MTPWPGVSVTPSKAKSPGVFTTVWPGTNVSPVKARSPGILTTDHDDPLETSSQPSKARFPGMHFTIWTGFPVALSVWLTENSHPPKSMLAGSISGTPDPFPGFEI